MDVNGHSLLTFVLNYAWKKSRMHAFDNFARFLTFCEKLCIFDLNFMCFLVFERTFMKYITLIFNAKKLLNS